MHKDKQMKTKSSPVLLLLRDADRHHKFIDPCQPLAYPLSVIVGDCTGSFAAAYR